MKRALACTVNGNGVFHQRAFFALRGYTAATNPGDFALPDTIVARDIINVNKLSYLREHLQNDDRFRMSMSEFKQLLQDNEIESSHGEQFLTGMHQCGVVLYYPKKSPNWIYLKPRAITRELLSMLDPDGSVSKALVAKKAETLVGLQKTFNGLNEEKLTMDIQAEKSSRKWTWAVIGGMGIQGAVLTRLIWWDLSWDVMEPVTYLMAFSYMTFGWAYYTLSKDDIAEYGTLAGRFVRNSKKKLYKKAGFDEGAFYELQNEIVNKKNILKSYGVILEEDKSSYPLPVSELRASPPQQEAEEIKANIADKA